MRLLHLIIILILTLSGCMVAQAQMVQTHPRLWIRQQDIPLLKAKATPGNPYFVSLRDFAEDLKAEMGEAEYESQFTGQFTRYSTYPAETMAMMFAFMSLITDGAESDDYATRAYNISMRIINEASLGAADGLPWRDGSYAVGDRSRWYGFGLPLAIDWVYHKFSTDDKQKIRTAFLRWCDENNHATTTTDNHPLPFDGSGDHPVKLSAQLLENQSSDAKSHRRLRYSLNNFYLAHLRNLWLMSACLDDADDANGELHAYMDDVTGAWAYVSNIAANSPLAGKGGLSPEGFLYGPSAYGRWAQGILAMYTSGESRPDVPMRGEQSTFNTQHWNDVLPAILNSMSPQRYTSSQYDYNNVFLPMNYGSIQRFKIEDMIDLFGPLAWYYTISGTDAERLNAIKWFQMHVPQGGASTMSSRIGYSQGFFERAMFYFMIFDPADNPTDPRATIPTTWHAEGIGRILSRTDWSDNASVFGFKCGFNRIDHQLGDALSFSLYRKGAFLTSQLNGYDFDTGVSSCLNSLALENNTPGASGPQSIAYQYGSQWFLNAEGDGTIPFFSNNDDYLFATADATELYKYVNPWVTPTGDDITHASRSIIWLKPDHLVIYDRATSKTENRYKQFWMSIPDVAVVTGKTASVAAPNNQVLHITNLLPANAVLTPKAYTHDGDANGYDEPAANDPMKHRLMVEDPSNPKNVRFLHVLQGRDNNQATLSTSLVASSDNLYEGASVGEKLILFKRDLDQSYSPVVFTASSQIETVILTGIKPLTSYTVDIADQSGGSKLVTVQEGNGFTSDAGGTLSFSLITLPRNITAVENPEDITVSVGTAFESLSLPQQVNVTLSDNSAGVAGVVFNQGNYDANVEGSYILTGTIVPEGNTTNTLNLTASITIHVAQVNAIPSDIILTNNIITINDPIGSVIGTLSTVDADAGDTHTYSLVSGEGDDNNAFFSIDDNTLLANSNFDDESISNYTIRIQTTDQQNASFAKSFTIQVMPDEDSDGDIFIPTLFTPNGDGMNDLFVVRGSNIESIVFKIFDRRGAIVFETTDVSKATITGWDGTYKGKQLPPGVYSWILKGKLTDGTSLSFNGKHSGNITIVR